MICQGEIILALANSRGEMCGRSRIKMLLAVLALNFPMSVADGIMVTRPATGWPAIGATRVRYP